MNYTFEDGGKTYSLDNGDRTPYFGNTIGLPDGAIRKITSVDLTNQKVSVMSESLAPCNKKPDFAATELQSS
jgi:hypothetical protein